MQLEVRRLQRRLEKRPTIFITHDQEEALVLSDRIAVGNKGTHPADRHHDQDLPSGRPTISSPTSWAESNIFHGT